MKCITNLILIFIMLLSYSGFIYFDIANLFATDADNILFLFYTVPLMVVLLLIMLQECYRRQVTGKLDLKRFLIQVIAGGAMVPILGILIAPVSLSLFSLKAASLVVVGACSGLIGGTGARGLLECLLRRSNKYASKEN